MAELGSINVIPVNSGVSGTDRRAELQAIQQGLASAPGAIKSLIVKSVTDDMVDAIDAVQVQEVPEAPPFDAPLRAEARLKADLDRWLALSANGTTSQQTLAEMRVKEVLNTAQARFGFVSDELQARAGQVLAGSAQLQALGLEDAAAAATGREAQGRIDDIQKFAVSELGMNPALPMNSPAWRAQYVEFSQLKFENENKRRFLETLANDREVESTVIAEEVSEAIQGRKSLIRGARRELRRVHGFDAALREIQKGDQGDLALIQEFVSVGAPRMLEAIQEDTVAFFAQYDEAFEPKLAGTKDALVVRQNVNDFVAEQDAIIALLKSSVDDMPDAIRQIASLDAIRGANIMRGIPDPFRNYTVFMNGPGKGLMEASKLANSDQGLVLLDRLGRTSTGGLQAMFPEFLGPTSEPSNAVAQLWLTSGQGQISPGMSPAEVNRTLTTYQKQSEAPYLIKTTTDAQEAEAAYWSIDNHMKAWSAAINTPDLANPVSAATFLTGFNNSLHTFNSLPIKPPDSEEEVRAGLADERLLEAIVRVGDGPTVVNQRRAFGVTATEWYENTNPGKRQANAVSSYNNTRIGEVPLRDLVLVDINSMSTEGVFAYTIDPRLLKQATKRVDEKSPGAGFNIRSSEDKVRNQIIEAMRPIAIEVNESLIINRNLEIAKAVSVNEDLANRSRGKLRLFEELGWLQSFNYTTDAGLN